MKRLSYSWRASWPHTPCSSIHIFMLFTAQAQSFVQPNLAFLAPAGMTGVGKAVETAVEPAGETEPVVQEGGHAPISQLAGPSTQVPKTSPSQSQSFVQPNLAFLAPAGMTGVGKAVETAVEPARMI